MAEEEDLELLLEELQLDYDEKCDEVSDLQRELRATNIEVQQLQARLKAAMGAGASPNSAVSLPSATCQQETRVSELNTLLLWLANHVDLTRTETFDVGFKFSVGGRAVTLQRISQWPLSVNDLRLSVPDARQREMQVLLAAVRSAGVVPPSALARFATNWELVRGEIGVFIETSEVHPALLLKHRDGQQSMLVACWPTQEKLRTFYDEHGPDPEGVLRIGDRVEAEYEGRWYPGYVHFVDMYGKAGIQCDEDPKGVFTITPFCCVRKIESEPSEEATAGAAESWSTTASEKADL